MDYSPHHTQLLSSLGNLLLVLINSQSSSLTFALKLSGPRRVSSLALLSGEMKRPGDYFVAKIGQETTNNNNNINSNTNNTNFTNRNSNPQPTLPTQPLVNKPSKQHPTLLRSQSQSTRLPNELRVPPKAPPPKTPTNSTQNSKVGPPILAEIPHQVRPCLGDLVLSLPLTDDDNSQFEMPENLLSISSSSIVSPSTSPMINSYAFNNTFSSERINEEDETSFATDYSTPDFCDLADSSMVSGSHSTITLRKLSTLSLSMAGKSSRGGNLPFPPLRSASTGQLMLKRNKSKYLNAQEVKERQQLRKKLYDENDDDGDLQYNDLDLVFNVPVIRSQSELFLKTNRSHLDLMLHGDLPGPSKHNNLPGLDTLFDNNSDLFIEEEEDQEISDLISKFYIQTLESISKLIKDQRSKEMMYKLPSYIRSQGLIDDVSLMSPQKLNVLDHSRPINLPPKSLEDISKHNKELRRCLEAREVVDSNLKKRSETYSLDQFYKQWKSLHDCSIDVKEFAKKLYNSKNSIRGLNWKSRCPEEFRYDIFVAFLTTNTSTSTGTEFSIPQIEEKFDSLWSKLEAFPKSVTSPKDAEYHAKIDEIILKPFFMSILDFLKEESNFDISSFKKFYRELLYLQTMNEEGLQPHETGLLIPYLLLMFSGKTLKQIFVLLELINLKIFNKDFVRELNILLSQMPQLKRIHKSYGLDHSGEFESLNSTKLWNILQQMGDAPPSGLSAPSTPVTKQGARFSLQLCSLGSLGALNEEQKDVQVSLSLEILHKFIQSLVVYTNSSSPKKFQLKLVQSLLLTIFKYYHFGWNNYGDLLSQNIAIKLSKSNDPAENFLSFSDKWNACLLEV